jgi:acyl carrier protein phosphodiesterase
MNFLAHAYLSFGDPSILTGNMVSDFVKGSARFGFRKEIQQGISLHRIIDAETDIHPATQKAKTIFRNDYRLYSAPIVDIVFDHFLATDPSIFDDASLSEFAKSVYEILEHHANELPPRFFQMLYYMKTDNWLYHYRTKEGIGRSIKGLIRRASFISDSDTAIRIFNDHYMFLKSCYEEVFPDVKKRAKFEFDVLKVS